MEYRLKIVLYKKHLPQIQNAFGLNGKIKAILIIVSIFIFFLFFPIFKNGLYWHFKCHLMFDIDFIQLFLVKSPFIVFFVKFKI